MIILTKMLTGDEAQTTTEQRAVDTDSGLVYVFRVKRQSKPEAQKRHQVVAFVLSLHSGKTRLFAGDHLSYRGDHAIQFYRQVERSLVGDTVKRHQILNLIAKAVELLDDNDKRFSHDVEPESG